MIRRLNILWSVIVPCMCMGQYSYFNVTQGESGDLESELSGAIEYFENEYYTWGLGNSNDTTFYHISKFNLIGEPTNQLRFELPYEFLYVGATNTFQKAFESDEFYVMGTKLDTLGKKGYVVKINANLDTLWSNEYAMYDPDTQISGSATLEDGLIIIGGYGDGPGQRGSYIAKLGNDGNIIWFKTIHEPSEGAFINSDVSAIDNGFVVSGAEGGGLNTEGRIEYLNSEGEFQWFLEGQGGFFRGSMRHIFTSNGHVLAIQSIGYEYIPNWNDISDTYSKVEVRKVDIENGEFSEIFEFIEEYDLVRAGPIDAIESVDNGIVILGVANKLVSGSQWQTAFLFKVNSSFELEWYRELNYNFCAPCVNILWDLELAPDGGYIMAGTYQNPTSSDPYSKSWLVKVDACGDVVYNGCWPVGIEETNNSSSYLIIQNPVQNELMIQWNLSTEIQFTNFLDQQLVIMDITGKEIYRESLKGTNPGASHTINLSSIPSGIYTLH